MSSSDDRLKQHYDLTKTREQAREKAVRMKAGGYSNAEIAKELGLNENTVRVLLDQGRLPKGHQLTAQQVDELAKDLKGYGYSEEGIAHVLRLDEAKPVIEEYETMWFPGIYHGRSTPEYTQKLSEVSAEQLIELVQKRAQEDGEWAIANGHVGDNEDKMRKMMAWVSDPKHIRQCVEYIAKENMTEERTVDYVCRDLANGSKWAGGSL